MTLFLFRHGMSDLEQRRYSEESGKPLGDPVYLSVGGVPIAFSDKGRDKDSYESWRKARQEVPVGLTSHKKVMRWNHERKTDDDPVWIAMEIPAEGGLTE